MPTSRHKLNKKSRSPGQARNAGGKCQHSGKVYFSSLEKARKAAGDGEEARTCAYCRGAHLFPSKRKR
jgi:hypothetical protein